MTSGLENTILRAFPPQPLGSAAKELRRLHALIGDGAGLDLVVAWTDMVEVLLSDTPHDAAGHIMLLERDAWCALVPAWMVAALRAPSGARFDAVFGSVVAVLDPRSIWKTSDIFFERVAGLTPTQRAAVAEFVSWAIEQPQIANDLHASVEIARLRAVWIEAPAERTLATVVCVWGRQTDELLFEGSSTNVGLDDIRSVLGPGAFPEDPQLIGVHPIPREQGMKLIALMGLRFEGDGEFHVNRESVQRECQ